MDRIGATIADLKAWIEENNFPDDAMVTVWGTADDIGEGQIHVNQAEFQVYFTSLD